MRMPKDFIDAINEAVKAINENAGTMVSGSFTLGSDFDHLLHRGGPNPFSFTIEEMQEFNALFESKRDLIKKSLIDSAVDVELRRMAGERGLESFPETKKKSVDLNDFVKELD